MKTHDNPLIESAIKEQICRYVARNLTIMYNWQYYDVSHLKGRPGDLFVIYPCEDPLSVFVELAEPDYTELGCFRLYPIPMNAVGQPLSAKVIQA